MIARALRYVFLFILLCLQVACSQEPNEDALVEMSCTNASGSWKAMTISCDGVVQSDIPHISIVYNPGEDIVIKKGDSSCYEQSTWGVQAGAEVGEIVFSSSAPKLCYTGYTGADTNSCTTGSYSCSKDPSPSLAYNNFSTCAVTENTLYLERKVTTSIFNSGHSYCQQGEVEKIEMVPGRLAELPTLGPVVATRFVILSAADTVVGQLGVVNVEAQNSSGAVATDFQDDVTLNVGGSASGGGVVDIVNGRGTLNITDTVAESVNLTLTDHLTTGLDVSSTENILFVPDVPASIVINQQPTSANSLEAINPAVSVSLYDSYGNLATNASSEVTLSFNLDPSGGLATPGGDWDVTPISGMAVFSDLTIDYAATGYSLDVAYPGVSSVASATFDILPIGSITVSSISQNTDETGAQGTFTVVLDSAPLADVVVSLSSDDVSEGVIDKSILTFTSGNWFTPQVVTVTGQADGLPDGNVNYNIITMAASSADSNYNGVDPADVPVINIDSATSPGFTVSTISNDVSEQGTTGTFDVVLDSPPSNSVSINLSVSDASEISIDQSSLTFTVANWFTPQTVTVTGEDDAIEDGHQAVTVITAPSSSADPNYNGINPADVNLQNMDDDTVGILVTGVSGDISEQGQSSTFTVRLISPPSADVDIGIASSDTSEGTVDVSNLTFTVGNWSTPQAVTITGVDDAITDGDQLFSVRINTAVSADSNYNGINPPDIYLYNYDDDSVGIMVSELSGDTTEAGSQSTFTIRLTSPPTGNVVINLSSSDVGEATIAPASVTFTPANWMDEQTVQLTGVDDAVADGDQSVTAILSTAASSDPSYNGIDAPDISFLNFDDDTIGVKIEPASGLTTNEAGTQAEVSLSLRSPPTADVTLTLTNGDPGEVSLSSASLVFTDQNWMVPQVVTLTGVDDAFMDGSQLVNVVTDPLVSGDVNYNGLDPSDILVTNFDDDSPGVEVTPLSGDKDRLLVHEYGSQALVQIRLKSQPSSSVSISFSISDPTEGNLSTSNVVFTPANWSSYQSVTVTGVDDGLFDGLREWEVNFSPVSSADPFYLGMNLDDIYFATADDETPGVTLVPDTSRNELFVFEYGSSENFQVVLDSQPTANVTITITADDPTETNTTISTLIFTPENWNTPQSSNVYGIDDVAADGNQAGDFILAASSPDGDYDGIGINDLKVICVDDEVPAFFLSPATSNQDPAVTSESGQSAFFEVQLTSAPTADVTLTFNSNDLTEGIPSVTELTFTPLNWNAPQRVWVSGIDDGVMDGDQPYKVQFNGATSTDPNYNGEKPGDVVFLNLDDD